jgi:two-component system NtrC family sensor kinase
MSVSTRLRLASGVRIFGALAVGLILGLVGLSLWHGRFDHLESAEHGNENLARVLAEQTARTIQAVDLTLVGLGNALSGSAARERSAGEIERLLAHAVATSPYLRALFATDQRGWIIHRSTPTPPVDVSDRSYFTRQRDGAATGFYLSQPLTSRVDGQWAIIASRPLAAGDGRFAGVVGATLDPQSFETFYAPLRVGRGGSVSLFLRDGTLLARHPHAEALIGTSFADRPPFRDLLARRPEGNARTSEPDGARLLLSYRSVPGFPLVVVVSTSEEEALVRWWGDVRSAGIGAVVLVAIIGALTFALQRKVRTLTESEAQFRSIFEHSLDAMALITLDGRMVEVNPEALRRFGACPDASCETLVDPADTRLGAAVAQRARTGWFRGELRLRDAAGAPITADVYASTFQDANGDPRIAVIARDVTHQRALEQQARLHAAALEAAANGIIISDRDGVIVWVNSALTTLTGHTAPEAIGRGVDMFYADEDTPEAVRQRWATIRSGRVWQGQLGRRRKDGSRFIADLTIAPVPDPVGEITHYVAVVQDITERVRAQEELQRRRELALQREKLAEMGQLLAGVAHELNNPLSVVLGHTNLLQRHPDPAVGRRAGIITTAAQRCSRIVRNFLALARQYPPEMTPVSLNAIATDTLELLGYQLRVESIEVETRLDPELPPLAGDAHRLQQVLVNLVTNAYQALRATPQPRRLAVVTAHDPVRERVSVEVRDSGPGMAPETLERMFEPFFTTKPPGEGTGLGLPISLGIIQGHGGTLTARSAPGGGTTFRIELPVRTAPTAEDDPTDASTAPSPMRVLVVDDEPEVVALLRDMLAARGHRVETAADGAAALGRLMRGDVDAILCDVKMPVMDGIEFHATLCRERPELARRVVFVTGDTVSPATSTFLAGVSCPSVIKPFTEDSILQALAAVAVG